MAKKPLILMILDGWGLAPAGPGNAVTLAKTPYLDKCFAHCPHTELAASGEDVGLPAGQIGNSEVGHLNIGAGRIVYQELSRITRAIEDGSFFENKVLREAMERLRGTRASLHLMGLLSDGGVHSHIKHLEALLDMAKEIGVSKVFVHAFLDGRDVPPQSALEYVRPLEMFLKWKDIGKIATVSGRYYAMDRDKRWGRLEKVYDCLVKAEGPVYPSAEEGILASYAAGVTDEFVVPFRVAKVGQRGASAGQARIEAASCIRKGDSVIFFNFRSDRARELCHALNDETFDSFERPANVRPICLTGLTEYDASLPIPTAFPPEHYQDILTDVLSAAGLRQLRIAETEKYAHVTFFFNGGVETPAAGEDRILIPSPKVATYDLQPEMSAPLVTDALLQALDKELYDVVILNFANPDMVGHTGVLPAAVRAMETVDACVGKVADKVLSLGGKVCITADHGNLEKMVEADGTPCTAHTTNKVPFLLLGAGDQYQLHPGRLADIAPTLLELLHLPQPAAMSGKSLLGKKAAD